RSVRKVKAPARVQEEEIPAEYKTITKRVLKTPASIKEEVVTTQELDAKNTILKTPASMREENIPAEYTDLKVQVLKTPAGFRQEIVPAEYKTVTSRMVKTPAKTRTETIPAEYTTVTKYKLIKAGGFTEWREVLCNEKVQMGYTIRQIQQALKDRGYDPGTLDNAMGAKTKIALQKFQHDKGLPEGSLDLETLKALGIKY
ncbi:MAG: peptidoglycan-binding domain-containing protein, partial [Saprospiraceae bacterium]